MNKGKRMGSEDVLILKCLHRKLTDLEESCVFSLHSFAFSFSPVFFLFRSKSSITQNHIIFFNLPNLNFVFFCLFLVKRVFSEENRS